MRKVLFSRYSDMIIKRILLFFAFLAYFNASAQNFLSWRYNDRYFSISMGSGNCLYLGDLNTTYQVQGSPSAATLGVEVRLWSKVAARIEGSYFQLKSGDFLAEENSFERQRNLSFFSNNVEANIQGVFYLKEYGGDFHSRWSMDPYLTTGIGFNTFNPKTTFNGSEYQLRDFQTENKEYGRYVLNVPAGAGIKFKLNEFINLNLEIAYRFTFTDYLDDVSGNYPTVTQDDLRSLLINRKNEVGIINLEAYNQQVAGQPRGDNRARDHYIILAYKIEFFLPDRKGPLFKKPSAY